ncbi:DUF3365 domain-containing protein [uncultured Thalassolituus sp.]|uniref:Tll0287-like domain-containing protein n=1 Tax=uncultured Thalassolituus sp. TaxID=285273 RepID=UPI0026052931|nr:DUF3365 domain-containing protein [uncultured Thalassolituus sp.]
MRLCVMAGAILLPLWASAESVPPMLDEARIQTTAMAESLKLTLMAGMKADGPVAAISLCHTEAPAIAARFSEGGWTVGRTSEKLRNPANAPDDWEREVLKDFARQARQGIDISTLEASSESDDGEYRYMKAIAVGGPCVICHGQSLSPEVSSALSSLYPEDQARGYLPGQLRGAFTLIYRPQEH